MVFKILFFHKRISSKTIEIKINLPYHLQKLQTWRIQLQNSISNRAPGNAILHHTKTLFMKHSAIFLSVLTVLLLSCTKEPSVLSNTNSETSNSPKPAASQPARSEERRVG